MDDSYIAFISYRHHPLDTAVAKDVQHRLEHYPVPKNIRQKTGRKDIGRIFRDQEELAITADIGDNILDALKDAEFLIVILSTHTAESAWVQREIDCFLQYHDRKHILTVLADGEPGDVIPKSILEEERTVILPDGTLSKEAVQNEPLSCDYRKKRREARQKEIPRLAAALLDVPYDSLIQRQQRYRTQRALILMTVVASVALVFMGYFIYSRQRIAENYQNALHNQSMYLTTEATRQFENNQELMSMELALHAVPESPEEQNSLPKLYALLFKLCDACTNRYDWYLMSQKSLLTTDAPIKTAELFADEKRELIVDQGGTIYLLDTEAGGIIFKEQLFSHLGYTLPVDIYPYGEEHCLLLGDKDNIKTVICLALSDGSVLWERTYDSLDCLCVLENGTNFPDYVIYSYDPYDVSGTLKCISGKDGEVLSEHVLRKMDADSDRSSGFDLLDYDTILTLDRNNIFLVNIGYAYARGVVYNLETGIQNKLAFPEGFSGTAYSNFSDGSDMQIDAESGNLLIAGLTEKDGEETPAVASFRPDGSLLWLCNTDLFTGRDPMFLRQLPAPEENTSENDLPAHGLILADGSNVIVIDADSGKIAKELFLFGNGLEKELLDVWVSNSEWLAAFTRGGEYYGISLTDESAMLMWSLDPDKSYGSGIIDWRQFLLWNNNTACLYSSDGNGDPNFSVISRKEGEWEGSPAIACRDGNALYLLRDDGMISSIDTEEGTVNWTVSTAFSDYSYYGTGMSFDSENGLLFIRDADSLAAFRMESGEPVSLYSGASENAADNEQLLLGLKNDDELIGRWLVSEDEQTGEICVLDLPALAEEAAEKEPLRDAAGNEVIGEVAAVDQEGQCMIIKESDPERFLLWKLSDGSVTEIMMPEGFSYSDSVSSLYDSYYYSASDAENGKLVFVASESDGRALFAVTDENSGETFLLKDSREAVGEQRGVVCCGGEILVIMDDEVYRYSEDDGTFLGSFKSNALSIFGGGTSTDLGDNHVMLSTRDGRRSIMINTATWDVMAAVSMTYSDGYFWDCGRVSEDGTRGLYSYPLYTMDELAEKVQDILVKREHGTPDLSAYGITSESGDS